MIGNGADGWLCNPVMEEAYLEDGQVEITHRFKMYKYIRLIVVSYLFLYIGLLICILDAIVELSWVQKPRDQEMLCTSAPTLHV